MADLGKLLDDLYGSKVAGKAKRPKAQNGASEQAGPEAHPPRQETEADPAASDLPAWARDDQVDKAFSHWSGSGNQGGVHTEPARRHPEPEPALAADTVVLQPEEQPTRQLTQIPEQSWRRGDDDILPRKGASRSIVVFGSSESRASHKPGLLGKLLPSRSRG